MPSSRGSSQSMDQTRVSYVSRIGRRVFYPLSYLGSLWIHSPLIVKNLVNSKTGISFPFSGYINFLFDGLPWWLSWKRICLQYGRPRFHSWVRKILWRRERLHTPLFWSGEFLGLYSPWGLKESDTTERLSLSLFKLTDVKKSQLISTPFQSLVNSAHQIEDSPQETNLSQIIIMLSVSLIY